MNSSTVFIDVEKQLSKKLECDVKIIASKSIGGGSISHASKIETNVGEFFLKWNENCPADLFIREAEGLTELKKAAGNYLFVPEVFLAKEVDSTPGFLVQEYLPVGHQNSNSSEKLGRGLAFLHQYKNNRFGFYNNNYCGATPQNNSWSKNWVEFFRDNRLRFLLGLIKKERPLSSSEIKIYDKLLKKLPELIPENTDPVLIHGDLWSGNYIYTQKEPAIIDPAAYYADREMEFGIITLFGGFSSQFFDAYNEVNPLPADWRKRNLLYQLYHLLNHYYLFGGGYREQSLQIAKSYI